MNHEAINQVVKCLGSFLEIDLFLYLPESVSIFTEDSSDWKETTDKAFVLSLPFAHSNLPARSSPKIPQVRPILNDSFLPQVDWIL